MPSPLKPKKGEAHWLFPCYLTFTKSGIQKMTKTKPPSGHYILITVKVPLAYFDRPELKAEVTLPLPPPPNAEVSVDVPDDWLDTP